MYQAVSNNNLDDALFERILVVIAFRRALEIHWLDEGLKDQCQVSFDAQIYIDRQGNPSELVPCCSPSRPNMPAI
jgi:hypothetical protein